MKQNKICVLLNNNIVIIFKLLKLFINVTPIIDIYLLMIIPTTYSGITYFLLKSTLCETDLF